MDDVRRGRYDHGRTGLSGFMGETMKLILAIALGGSVGAVARYLVANGIYDVLGRSFPHGTLFVNVSGSFLMGLLTELMLQRFAVAAEVRALALIGFLGAYTTFSSFALESLYLFEEGSLLKAFLNILLSTVLCIAGVWFGLIVGRNWFVGSGAGALVGGLPVTGFVIAGVSAFACATGLLLLVNALTITPVRSVVALVMLVGVTTVLSTLWLVFRLPESRLDVGGLLGLFAINAIGTTVVVWLGASTGNWLWQLNQSR